ncbi:hypothetical protein [Parachitinimonas caeni]|uniref:Uncharacterized protein n=1 Tax=Parachitinimonas caeni TaxID=3031301 RepID=A0ABT7E3D1_9NEIS|nr:hypothetical protein [Parachitinimonas caeni]MDK2126821.1 hypothetical protein [Parachitinimonas caeni]
MSEQKKRQIIFDNLPLWALHDAEGFPPKPIQNYIKFDIKEARYIGNSDVNLMPFFDRSHHIVGGSKNHSDSSKHILGKYIAKFSEETSTRDRLFIDPRQAPTYAFYQERENGDIWIRYFLFFGYNNVPNSPVENHFADVVHISVNLRNVDGSYIPAEYFYSAHSDGALRNAENVEIRYFDLEGGDKLNQISFDEAKRRGKFHPLVYLANGTHEAYTQSGYHHILGVDNANFGVLIAPFSNPFAADPHDRNRELVAPVYSWDMTAPKYNFNSDMQLNPATASSAPPVMRNIPSQLSPQFGNEFQDIFFYRHSDGFMYWVVNIGHDENSAEGLGPCHAKVWEPCTPGVSTPPVKVFDWVNFNE